MIAQRLDTISIKDVLGATDAAYRSPGVHVTDLIALVIKKIDPDLYDKEYNEKTRENWMHAGFLWERILTRVFQPDHVLRVGELYMDGVYLTPDWIEHHVEPVSMLILGESKATWKTAREFDTPTPAAGLDLTKFIAWKLQIMAYCKAAGILIARLHVLFINGEYAPPIPEIRSYLLTFTQREVDESWDMLLNTGRKAELL